MTTFDLHISPLCWAGPVKPLAVQNSDDLIYTVFRKIPT